MANENDSAALGAFGAAGFCFLMAVLVLGVPACRYSDLVQRLSTVNLLAFLIGTIGGLGSIFAFVISARIRAYDRISVFIAFASIWVMVLLLDLLWRKWRVTAGRRASYVLLIAVLLGGGILDQATPGAVPPHEQNKAIYAVHGEFIRRVEKALPPGSMVFQLPYCYFPEVPEGGEPGRMWVYDHMAAYLHSHQLRWNYATFRGRYWDLWQKTIAAMPAEQMLESLALSGFAAVYIDRWGYSASEAGIEQRIAAITGETPILRSDGRVAVYKLQKVTARLRREFAPAQWDALRDRVLHPLMLRWAGGFSGQEGTAGNYWRWCSAKGELWIENTSDHDRQLRLEATVAFGRPEYSDLRVEGPGYSRTLEINSAGQSLDATLLVPPGRHVLRLTGNAAPLVTPADPRVLVFQVRNLRASIPGSASWSAEWGKGCWGLEGGPDGWHWCSGRGELSLHNPHPDAHEVSLRMRLVTRAKSTVQVEGPNYSESFETSPSGTLFAKTILWPPGEQRLRFTTKAPRVVAPHDPRELVMQVREFHVQDPSQLASEVLFAN